MAAVAEQARRHFSKKVITLKRKKKHHKPATRSWNCNINEDDAETEIPAFGKLLHVLPIL